MSANLKTKKTHQKTATKDGNVKNVVLLNSRENGNYLILEIFIDGGEGANRK